MTVTETDLRNGIIIAKIGGSLSMLGSFLIVRDIRRKRCGTKDHAPLTSSILCELSFADFFSSFFAMFMSTWMVPKESGAYLAAGTDASCTAQGFLSTCFYLMSILSNTTLAITYCLIVKKGWKDNAIQKRTKWTILGIPPISAIVLASTPLFSGAYNYSGGKACAPKAHPLGCDDPDSEVECTRGEHGNTMFLTIFAIQLAASIIIAAAILVLVHSVMIHERKMDRYSVNSSATRALTKQTTWQGFWYTAAFAVAWWPFILASIIKIFAGLQSIALYYISAVTFPLQGLFNAFLYFRPRYKAARERHGQDSRIKSICRILHVSMLPMVNSFKTDKTRKTDNDEMPINNDGDGEVGASDKNGNASFCENE